MDWPCVPVVVRGRSDTRSGGSAFPQPRAAPDAATDPCRRLPVRPPASSPRRLERNGSRNALDQL